MGDQPMNVASLELCKELYELSGWRERVGLQYFPDKFYATHLRLDLEEEVTPTMDESYEADFICPAYDLGYLLRKLPHKTRVDKHTIRGHPDRRRRLPDHDVYNAFLHTATNQCWQQADTPEDAAAKLAIELFKQGRLKREES